MLINVDKSVRFALTTLGLHAAFIRKLFSACILKKNVPRLADDMLARNEVRRQVGAARVRHLRLTGDCHDHAWIPVASLFAESPFEEA